MAILGRYIIILGIFDILAGTKPGKGGEIQLTDALKVLAGREDKRNTLIKTIKEDIQSSASLLKIEEVNQQYLKLQKYAHADETAKKAHVDNVQIRKL